MFKKETTFFGGVHPTNGSDKALTENGKIVQYIPDSVKVNAKQGLGPAGKCIVSVGDNVSQGQVLFESTHFLSASIHASVSGIVTEVTTDYVEIKTESCKLVNLEADYYNKWVDVSIDKEVIVEKLKDGGLVGMGGAGFPVSVKYATKDPITHLLINACECEPYLSCDDHLMLEQGMAILNGIAALKKACGAKKAIICMEDNKLHCKESLEKLLVGHEEEIQIKVLPTQYPQGGEKQLILATMNVEIPAGALPSSVGAIVSNIHTAKAAADVVYGNVPSTSRVITITGDVNEPSNYLVPLGTNVGELVALAKDVKSKNNKVILGGPMTGRCIGTNMDAKAITATDVCVSKVSGGLIVLEGYHPVESDCIRCGACGHACPAGLSPFKIDFAIREDNVALAQKLHATECIGCGCCSYVCPAKRELTHFTVIARDKVRMKMREEANRG